LIFGAAGCILALKGMQGSRSVDYSSLKVLNPFWGGKTAVASDAAQLSFLVVVIAKIRVSVRTQIGPAFVFLVLDL